MQQADGMVVDAAVVAGTVAVDGVEAVVGTEVGAWAYISARRLVLTLDITRTHTTEHRTMGRPIIIRRRPFITLRCSLRR
ncbi:hypothetical protein [Candidatus Nitrotoga sp. 1052]|uniref:hypothetical protein n=1 Tax=Candidatus Nitrotoga sp. 1052 TaxID=2886964 RepID=UPI001EF6296C|nr:hypothetical protein [Candidatus Nitrotoga sp. 1052]CAH1083169.1 conserved hypothetical protein [Candidatus Nitrotoga sp. 1052]